MLKQKWYKFCVLLIILVGDIFPMYGETYWALTTSSTFPQSTPKIANIGMKWYNR